MTRVLYSKIVSDVDDELLQVDEQAEVSAPVDVPPVAAAAPAVVRVKSGASASRIVARAAEETFEWFKTLA
jgi:hypothetical protein